MLVHEDMFMLNLILANNYCEVSSSSNKSS